MNGLDYDAPFDQLFVMARLLRQDITTVYRYNDIDTKVIYPTSLTWGMNLFQLGEEETCLRARNRVELRNHIRTRFNKVNSAATNIGFRLTTVILIDHSDVIGISGNPMKPDLVWRSAVSRVLVKGGNLHETGFIRQYDRKRQ